MSKKILITNPRLSYLHGHKFIQPDWPSLNLPYLASLFSGYENDIIIVDNSHRKSYDFLEEIYRQFKPDILACSIIAGCDIPDIAEELKKFSCVKIVGGQGASYNAEKFTDIFVCKDEGEKAIPHFMLTGEVKDFDRISLDDSPLPMWGLVAPIRSRTFPTFTGAIEMSRGCPYNCEFCSIASFWHSLRTKSNQRIIEELFYLDILDRKHVYLSDDSFGVNKNKHMELFEKILRCGFDMKFFAQIRADIIANNPDMIKLAAKAGFYGFLVGFDSYDQNTLDVNAKTTSAEINDAAARILRENKIAIFGSHIYGLPAQTNFAETFRRGRKNSDLFAMPYFDGRPKIQKPAYDSKYAEYVKRHQFSLKELAGLLHPNKAIRELKIGGLRRYINCSMGYKHAR